MQRLGVLDVRFERVMKCARKDDANDEILWRVPIAKDSVAVIMPGYQGREYKILEARKHPRSRIMTVEHNFAKWIYQKNVLKLNVTSKPMALEHAGPEIVEWARTGSGLGIACFDIFVPNPPTMETFALLARERAFAKGATMTVTSGYWRLKPKTSEMYEKILDRIEWENPWPPTIEILRRIFKKEGLRIRSAVDHPYRSVSDFPFVVTEINL